MGKYDELTKYIPLIKDDSFGEWVFDKENDGSMEHPFRAPYINYSDAVSGLHRDIYAFCEAHPEYEHTQYKDTLEANGLAWSQKAMEEADVSDKDAKCVIALLMGMTRAERFCDGAMLAFLKKGCVLRWLERLKEIDGGNLCPGYANYVCFSWPGRDEASCPVNGKEDRCPLKKPSNYKDPNHCGKEAFQTGRGIKPGMMKYCVVGNIVKEHLDENGMTRYGTAAFPGGRKIYISRRLWDDGVVVMGLNRFKSRYAFETVPLALIENIRFSKTFSSKVLELMRNDSEFPDMWWLYKEEDKIGATEFAQLLNRIKSGDSDAYEQYKRNVMERFR